MPSESSTTLYVVKRNGESQPMAFDKIQTRLRALAARDPPLTVNPTEITLKIIEQLHDGIPTTKIDELCAEQCAGGASRSLQYATLGGRIAVSNCHKNTPTTFASTVARLAGATDCRGATRSLVSDELLAIVDKHGEALEAMIDFERDYRYDYFGFKTLERAYLMRVNKEIVERPQCMLVRVSIGIHGDDIDRIRETYEAMSLHYFTHATPTLFNAGTPRPQMSSCYLLSMEDDSIEGIFNTLKDCASISKWAGGIGLHMHNIRAKGSHIRGTNGHSNGLVPMLRVFNETARYVDQGGGKRNGSIAIYLEPWHADIVAFLDLRKNHGDEDARARDLFYGLWVPDAFMVAVKENKPWHLFCPDECPGLADVHGSAFQTLYDSYADQGKAKAVVQARELWFRICDSQMETGTPYILYKDAANSKSNQQNLGTIKSSNLCTEIIEYSDPTQTAVCNLASIALPRFVKDGKLGDEELAEIRGVVKAVTRNLNRIIDRNFYPTGKTRRSNMLHRPIGIGVQGLSDTFNLCGLAFDSDEASALNTAIFASIYYAAMEASIELAEERAEVLGSPLGIASADAWRLHADPSDDACQDYSAVPEPWRTFLEEHTPTAGEVRVQRRQLGAYTSFEGSPLSQGKFQFDLWNEEGHPGLDWDGLRERVVASGARNSLLLAPMPTASTAQILGNSEGIDPITSNVYARRTNAGDHIVVNKQLHHELSRKGLWTNALKDNIVANGGSIQQVDGIDADTKKRFRTVWEMPPSAIVDLARSRAPYVCQSQSMSLWLEDPNYKTLTEAHFHAWKKGLKTGLYYMRRKPAHQPQKFTITPPDEQDCEACGA